MSPRSPFVRAVLLLKASFAWLLMLAFSTGCGDAMSGDSRAGFHNVTLNWHLRNLDGTLMTSCPAGFTTLATHLYKLGYVEPPDALIIQQCSPEGTLTQAVATAGELLDPTTKGTAAEAYFDYSPAKDIWVEVTEATQTTFAAKSYLYHVETLTSDLTIDFDIYPAGGTGVAVWTLLSGLTSAPLMSCSVAGVDQIEAAVRPYGDTTAPLVVVGTWPCNQVDPYFYYNPDGNSTLLDADNDPYKLGTGHTQTVAPGDYFVELRAKRNGVVVGTTSEASFTAEDKNTPHVINIDIDSPGITITDR